MKKTVKLIERLQALAEGETIAASSLNGDWIDEMLADGVLQRVVHGRHTSLRAVDRDMFLKYIASKYDIRDLKSTLLLLMQTSAPGNSNTEGLSRATQVAATGDSKFVQSRTMKGFLINSYEDIPAVLNGNEILIHPAEGSYMFIYDYERFSIPEDVIVVGIENSENFRWIARQRYLFENLLPSAVLLFVSRYPQSKDLVRWLLSVPNRYVHFGDLDLAGIHIFLSEYQASLGSRSSFLIPRDYAIRIAQGNSDRYSMQYPRYGRIHSADPQLQAVIDCINREHKGYDQEGFIRQDELP